MKKRFLQGQVKAVNKDQKTVTVIASTGAVDRQGESLNPQAWDFSNYLKNPVLLWSHDAYALPIGKVLKVWVEAGVVMAETWFAEEENPFAATVAKLVRSGVLNAVSVGFLPTAVDPTTGETTGQELLELSYVNIPANQEALVMSRSGEHAAMFKSFKEAETKALESAKHVETKDAGTDVGDLLTSMETYAGQMTECIETMRELMAGKDASKKVEAIMQKSGRVLSEKNRGEIRLMVDACKQAADAGQKLLDATSPPEKKGDAPSSKAGPVSARLRALRIADKAVELLIHAEKEALSATQEGGAKQ